MLTSVGNKKYKHLNQTRCWLQLAMKRINFESKEMLTSVWTDLISTFKYFAKLQLQHITYLQELLHQLLQQQLEAVFFFFFFSFYFSLILQHFHCRNAIKLIDMCVSRVYLFNKVNNLKKKEWVPRDRCIQGSLSAEQTKKHRDH